MKKLSALSDTELVVLLAKGDASAYTEIYNRYSVVLYVFAYKRLDNRKDVRDLVFELFVCLWTKRTEMAVSTTLSTYFFNELRNKMLDIVSHRDVSSKYIDSFKNYCVTVENHSFDHLVGHTRLLALIEQEIAALTLSGFKLNYNCLDIDAQ